MMECVWQSTDDLKPEFLPKTDRGHVRGNHKIELHRAKTEPARFAQAMLGHCATDSLPAHTCRNHERCIGDVGSATGLVRAQNMSARNSDAWVFREISVLAGRKPVRQRVFTRDVWVQGISIPRRYNL